MLQAFGVVCALLETQRSGEGQVVDAAMVDGTATLMTMIWAFSAMGIWTEERGTNMLDTGTHFYDTYETSDGKYVSIGSIEPQFYAELLRLTGLEEHLAAKGRELPYQMDKNHWGELKAELTEIFASRSRDEWCEIMEGTDVCFAPVLTMSEAAAHPHNVARGTFVEHGGVTQPAPSPRFSRTPGEIQRVPSHPGQDTDDVLRDWLDLDAAATASLREGGAVA